MLTNPLHSAPTSSFSGQNNRDNDSSDDSASSSSIDYKHTLLKPTIPTAWAKKPFIKPEKHQKKPSSDTSEHDILKTRSEALSVSSSDHEDDEPKDNNFHTHDKPLITESRADAKSIDPYTRSTSKDVAQISHMEPNVVPRRKPSNARSLNPRMESVSQTPESPSRHMRSLTLHVSPIENKSILHEGTNVADDDAVTRAPCESGHCDNNYSASHKHPPTFQQYHAPPHHQFYQRRQNHMAYYPYQHYYQRNSTLPIRNTMTPPFSVTHGSVSIPSIPQDFKNQPSYPMPWLWGTPMHQYPSHITYPVPYPMNSKPGNEMPGCSKIQTDGNAGIDNTFPMQIWMMSMHGRCDHVDDVILPDTDAYDSDLHQILTGTCQPLPEEKNLHDELYNVIHSLLVKHFPTVSLRRFGSTENGFSLRGADLDFCVITPSKSMVVSHDSSSSRTSHTLEDPSQFVSLFGEKLRLDPRFSANIKILSRARVPIIKLKDSVTGLSCDIGVNNVLALYNTKLLKVYGEICHKGSSIVVQLALLVKLWAKQRELNDPYWGTLSSYCYLMMVVYYLQQKSPPLLPILQHIPVDNNMNILADSLDSTGTGIVSVHVDGCTVRFISDPAYPWPELAATIRDEDKVMLANLLEGFFHFYAHEFNYANHVISIRIRSLVTKEMKQWTLEQNSIKGSFWFCVEDPFDIDQNLARTVSRNSLFHLRGQFIRANKLISKRVPFSRICSPYYP